ncbi:VWA domain-containing protein [Methanocalculus taiwanensis]|uniref:VWA domain-containing protein n=1 Tax=Methanocalculus taiwanensis TaxID=106207 RepID=A0ABD4TID4_9EURY|nr:VWA domain-containing protein [Methanocalculus taiwanensis]MCQ1538699.1 VWA domain-containing protein [Methanocalculus taiwanensis]
MRRSLLHLILLLVLITTPAAALIPDEIVLTTDREWVAAGSGDPAIITAAVYNQSTPLPGVLLTFTLQNPETGSLSNPSSETDGEGSGSVRFLPNTVSGDATIRVQAWYTAEEGMQSIEALFIQRIDHGEPAAIDHIAYPGEATVGSIVPISLSLRDAYGNIVDDQKEVSLSLSPEYITLTVTSAGGGAFFNLDGGSGTTLSIPVGDDGFVNASLHLDTLPAEHVILIDPSPSAIPSRWITINAIADAIPHSVMRDPSDLRLYAPADGASRINLFYTFYDEYGNRAGNRQILFSVTSPSGTSTQQYSTSALGEIQISYGPVITVGEVIISCTAVDNEAVSDSVTLEFYHTDPVAMLLTANPQMIPSADVDPDITADIRAKVIDARGNPVPGEDVSFSIRVIDTGDYIITSNATLDATEAVTNENGFAIVRFSPCAFTTDRDDPGYSQNATGTAIIGAEWAGQEKTVLVTWKNYPFLSISTMVEPETVAVNETINVTVTIVGDGWALQPDPVDVVLVIDTSGSMTGTDVSPNRMAAARNAAKDFVSQMDLESGRDRVAVASFSSAVTIHQPLTDDPATVNAAIDGLTANGATIMRRGYYEGIRHLKEEGRPGAVKAVILMGDGDWNLHGSPLATGVGFPDTDPEKTVYDRSYETTYGIARSAYPWSGSSYSFSPGECQVRSTRYSTTLYSEGYEWYSALPDSKGTLDAERWWYRRYPINDWRFGSVSLDSQDTNQNMSVYAMSGSPEEQVRVYTIGFAQILNSNVVRDITLLSEATGGSYVWAGDEEELTAVYTQIAGELITEAGVNTTLQLSHDNILINMTVWGGGELFDYVPMTRLSHYNQGGDDIVWIEGYPKSIDQTDDWIGINPPPYTLTFDIGTIHLHDVWKAEYQLRLIKDGTFELFGPLASVTFEGDTLTLPTTLISVIPPIEVIGLDRYLLEVNNLRSTAPSPVTDILPISWELTYGGSGIATQQVRYTVVDPMIYDRFGINGPYEWKMAGAVYSTPGPHESQTMDYLIDLFGLSGICLVKVEASAPGSPESRDEIAVPIGMQSDQAYILIE